MSACASCSAMRHSDSAACRTAFPEDAGRFVGTPFHALAPGAVPALAEAIAAARQGKRVVSGLEFALGADRRFVADVQLLERGEGRVLVTLEDVTGLLE